MRCGVILINRLASAPRIIGLQRYDERLDTTGRPSFSTITTQIHRFAAGERGSTTHTDKDTNAWWDVDLGSVVPISEIDVFLRANFESKGGLGIYLTPAPVKQAMLSIAFHDIKASAEDAAKVKAASDPTAATLPSRLPRPARSTRCSSTRPGCSG